jgi:hypothetical protein
VTELLLAALALSAAPPPRVVAALHDWGEARRAARHCRYQFTRTGSEYDVFKGGQTKTVWTGEVLIRRPDRLRVDIKDEKGGRLFTALATGPRAELYDYANKRRLVAELPAGLRLPEAAGRCASGSEVGLLRAVLEGMAWPVLGPPSSGFQGRFTAVLDKGDEHYWHVRLEPAKRWGWLPDSEWHVVLARRGGWLRRLHKEGPATG